MRATLGQLDRALRDLARKSLVGDDGFDAAALIRVVHAMFLCRWPPRVRFSQRDSNFVENAHIAPSLFTIPYIR